MAEKNSIESELNDTLEWSRLDDKKASRLDRQLYGLEALMTIDETA